MWCFISGYNDTGNRNTSPKWKLEWQQVETYEKSGLENLLSMIDLNQQSLKFGE